MTHTPEMLADVQFLLVEHGYAPERARLVHGEVEISLSNDRSPSDDDIHPKVAYLILSEVGIAKGCWPCWKQNKPCRHEVAQ